MQAGYTDVIVCHGCDKVLQSVPFAPGQQLSCPRCGEVLRVKHNDWLNQSAAFTCAGIVLFLLTLSFPFLGLEAAGLEQSSRLLSGVLALLERDYFLLGSLVFVTIFLMPLLELTGLSYLLLTRILNRRTRTAKTILHLLFIIRPWNMMEIFFIGVLVTTIKLGDIATLLPGTGLYAFAALVIVLTYSHTHLDREALWHWLEPNNCFRTRPDETLVVCNGCDALVGETLVSGAGRCPRCDSHLKRRIPNSYSLTLALLLAAVILYFPANLLPMMTTVQFGSESSDTIMSGIVHLFLTGNAGIALIVFVASMLVPVVKIFIIAYLLWAVRKGQVGNARQQALLYRLTEFIGRWSMVDVFVVTLLVALVQFGVLASIEPGGAILCFAGVVVLTMLAAETFDPRLLWDAQNE